MKLTLTPAQKKVLIKLRFAEKPTTPKELGAKYRTLNSLHKMDLVDYKTKHFLNAIDNRYLYWLTDLGVKVATDLFNKTL